MNKGPLGSMQYFCKRDGNGPAMREWTARPCRPDFNRDLRQGFAQKQSWIWTL